jgi:hypothetical protein
VRKNGAGGAVFLSIMHTRPLSLAVEKAMPARKPMIEGGCKPTLLQIVLSVLAAFFGVQNSRNRARDFTHGSAIPFVLVGILLTLLLVGFLTLLVRFVASVPG